MDMATHLWAPWATNILPHYMHSSRVGPDLAKVGPTEMAGNGDTMRVEQDHPRHLHVSMKDLEWIQHGYDSTSLGSLGHQYPPTPPTPLQGRSRFVSQSWANRNDLIWRAEGVGPSTPSPCYTTLGVYSTIHHSGVGPHLARVGPT